MWVKMMKSEKGISLLETIVAVALLGIISVCFLSGVATTTTARATADERATAKILAESQIEYLKKHSYEQSYNITTIPDEYEDYTVNLTIDNQRNGHIQKIIVAVQHHGDVVLTLESYKVRRDNN